MAQDGLFLPRPRPAPPAFRTPPLAILLQAAWGIVLVLTGTYGELVDSVVFGDWIFFGLTVAASSSSGAASRSDRREPGSSARPATRVVPALFVAAAAFAVVSAIRSSPTRAAFGTALLATGLPVYCSSGAGARSGPA